MNTDWAGLRRYRIAANSCAVQFKVILVKPRYNSRMSLVKFHGCANRFWQSGRSLFPPSPRLCGGRAGWGERLGVPKRLLMARRSAPTLPSPCKARERVRRALCSFREFTRISWRTRFHQHLTLAFVLLFASLLPAQEDEASERPGIPIVGRPVADFYSAAGVGVKLKAEAMPTRLASNQWLTFTLTITQLLNAADVQKPSLKALKEFEAFQVDEAKGLDPPFNPERADQRVFIYKLRPSSEGTTIIPEIAFHYYNPRLTVLRPQDKFPKALSNAVTIEVTAPAEPPPVAPAPLELPAFASHYATSDQICSATSNEIPVWLWIIGLVAAPLLALFWLRIWRLRYPDAARLAEIQRSRAVRRALSALNAAKRSTGEKEPLIVEIMYLYLHDRFALAAHARTPLEIASHLRSLPMPEPIVARAETFFCDCDAARFAPDHTSDSTLMDAAEGLIVALEENA